MPLPQAAALPELPPDAVLVAVLVPMLVAVLVAMLVAPLVAVPVAALVAVELLGLDAMLDALVALLLTGVALDETLTAEELVPVAELEPAMEVAPLLADVPPEDVPAEDTPREDEDAPDAVPDDGPLVERLVDTVMAEEEPAAPDDDDDVSPVPLLPLHAATPDTNTPPSHPRMRMKTLLSAGPTAAPRRPEVSTPARMTEEQQHTAHPLFCRAGASCGARGLSKPPPFSFHAPATTHAPRPQSRPGCPPARSGPRQGASPPCDGGTNAGTS